MNTDKAKGRSEWSPIEFLALISHELRNPIQAILGWAEIADSGPIDPETSARAIQVIKRNARRQAEMISQLTHFSRLNIEGLRLVSQPVALGPTIGAAIEAMTPQARAKNVNLEAAIDRLEVAVTGDPVWLQQVFTNLLSNAIKFTRPGGHVELCCAKRQNRAEVTVTDTGCGISEEFLPCVFDRFRRGPNDLSGEDGLGLGLAIARYVVEAHGGSISAHSDGLGCGSTFTVLLPFMVSIAGGSQSASRRDAWP